MNYINQLVDFIATPLGLIFLVIGFIVAIQANRNHPRLRWFVIAMFGFTASLSKFKNEFVLEPPPLVFPLQQIRELGRPLTIVLLGLLIVIAFQTKNIWRKKLIPQPIIYIISVQCVIFFKLLIYGDLQFAGLSAAIFGGLVLMIILGPSRWLENDRDFQLGVWAIAMVGVIFALANVYQAMIDVYPITFEQGWFLGTTGNPHHAAILITATLPCFLFLFLRSDRDRWLRWVWAGFLLLGLFALVMTASRTGAIMAVVSILVFFRYRGGKLLQIILIFGVLAALFLPYLSFINLNTSEIFSPAANKFTSLHNTRAAVWSFYWQKFFEYPIFGIPLQGDRLLFGESSWLGVLGGLGLIGTIPMLMFAWSCLKMIFKLDRLSKISHDYYLKSSLAMAGLLSLLVGGISEAYLLGNLTFSLVAVFLYLVLGNYIIELAQKEHNDLILQYYSGMQLNKVYK